LVNPEKNVEDGRFELVSLTMPIPWDVNFFHKTWFSLIRFFLFHLEKQHGPLPRKVICSFNRWSLADSLLCCNIVTLLGWQDISLGISRNMIQFGWNCTWALGCLILMMVLAQTHFTNTKGNMKSESCIEEKSGAGLWWWRSEPGSESFFSEAESRFFRCYSVCLKILISDSQKKVALMTSLLLQ